MLTETQELMFGKVLESILKLSCDQEKAIEKTHVNYNNFVQCCKHIIDTAQDWNNGFSLVFNSDYSKLRKDERFNFVKSTTK